MTAKELGATLGAGALVTAAGIAVLLSSRDATCYRQLVQMPCEDALTLGLAECKPGSLVSVDAERCLTDEELDAPLPKGWDAITKPEPIDSKDTIDSGKAITLAPPEKRGTPVDLPAVEATATEEARPARTVYCPSAAMWGHEVEGCDGAAKSEKPADLGGAVEVVP